jgi:RsiW-degrading membrane proteinase PrsW (M82 family)/CRP-like cAMP-binding protein
MPSTSTLIAYVIAAAIPAFAVYLIQALDLFQTAKFKTLLICVLWGAIGAFGLAYIINKGVLEQLMLSGATRTDSLQLVVRLTAPIIEEILKALILIYLIRQPSFRYFVDGAVYGFGVGIGFAVVENFSYIGASSNAALALAASRVLSTSLMHAMASAIVGISLGRLRRSNARLLPVIGILLAISVHVVYNNVVNTLAGTVLLLVAITIGLGGAAFIGLQINQGLNEEKKRFTQTFGKKSDVSEGEVQTIQRMGASSLEEMMQQVQATLGDANMALIRRMLVTQANIGILQNNLSSGNVTERLRKAWEEEIAERRAEYLQIRKELDRSVMGFMQRMFPTDDQAMWDWLQGEMAQSDPTMVHTFDMFMKASGLAQSFTPEQLESMADSLNRIEIFKNVSLADLENLGRAIKVQEFKDGEMLFDEGDEGDAMYMIEAGGISIFAVDDHRREKIIRTFAPGSVVGDFAVLDGQPRSARARAAGSLRALVLQRQMFKMFIQSRPQVILAVMKVLADKARFTTRSVEESFRNLSSMAQGDYAAVAQLDTASPVPAAPAVAPSAGTPEVEVTEVSSTVHSSLTQAFASFARKLQRRDEQAMRPQATG